MLDDSKSRYYIYNQVLPYDEDICHEFKGHRNIILGEVPPTSQKFGSRSAISKAINGFLNTGIGGTIYCGVTDDAVLKGLNFSSYQMDHMRVSVQDALDHYKPAVPAHRWKLEFVPLLEEAPSPETLQHVQLIGQKYDPKQRQRSHVIGTHQFCWCDKDAIAAFNNGTIYLDYVAEIIIHPWCPTNQLDAAMVGTKTKVHPLHEAEDGKIYIRNNASVQTVSLQDVIELTKSQVGKLLHPSHRVVAGASPRS
ncbi:schlafen-like protein 2 [Watersipora subatra]|uniref:schlafen-like protein 2 n=1 Tax=Watersipora subatra TaxID=2589382 RepID=UPI00355C0B81